MQLFFYYSQHMNSHMVIFTLTVVLTGVYKMLHTSVHMLRTAGCGDIVMCEELNMCLELKHKNIVLIVLRNR